MNYKPILFSTPMVRAILEGRKTMTRRTVKERHQPVRDEVIRGERMLCPSGWPLLYEREFLQRFCPYGQVGDVLWVRETFTPGHSYLCKDGFKYWCFKDGGQVSSRGEYTPGLIKYAPGAFDGIKWKPSIHMPKCACRIFLRITDIRVERLQDISEADALSESIDTSKLSGDHEHTPVQEFEYLWTSINGPSSWSDNPWVWVVSFEQIDRPGDFLTHKAPTK